jgi:uncharacterized protein YecT (DUF1311 family)
VKQTAPKALTRTDMTRCTHALMALTLLAMLSTAAHALDCQAATTQADLNACAYEDFLAANAPQAAAIKTLDAGLPSAQRQRWRAAQKGWIAWRTAQCAFESGAAAGASARGMVRWQCVTRLTRERTAAILRLSNCAEDDLACPGRKP